MKFSPYEILKQGRLENCMNALKNCQLVQFENRPGQTYLKLDKEAMLFSSNNPTVTRGYSQGYQACEDALSEICSYNKIQADKGYRVSNAKGYVEVYSELETVLRNPKLA